MKNPQIAIVVPTYNEKDNIPVLIESINKQQKNATIFIVDDQSPDGTAKVIRKLQKKYSNLKLISNSLKMGRGNAVIVGFKKALKDKNFKIFIEMDADLSHQPTELNQLIKIVKKSNKNVAIASRYTKGGKTLNWPIYRKVSSFIANHLLGILLDLKLSDYTNGFRAYSRIAIKEICQQQLVTTSYFTLTEVALILKKADFVFVETPCVFPNRTKGKSNTSVREILNNLKDFYKVKVRYH